MTRIIFTKVNWREVKEMFRDVVFICFQARHSSLAHVSTQVSITIRVVGQSSLHVGVPLPNCRASLPTGIFLMAGVGLGKISISAGEVTLPVRPFLPVGHG